MITIGIDASRANVRQRTGTEWYCFYVLHQFAKMYDPTKHRIVLYVKEPLVEDLQDLPVDWDIRILRWPPRLLWTQFRLSLAMFWPWRRPDILFIPAHTIPLIHPRRTVYVAHDLGFEREPNWYANNYIGGRVWHWMITLLTFGKYGTTELDYHRWSMRFAVRTASHIITISEFTKAELMQCYAVEAKRISVVHNGFDRTAFIPSVQAAANQPYLLYVGRIEKKKNIDHLIQAFILLKQRYNVPHQLWLAGTLGFGFKEFKPMPDIRLLGYVPGPDLPKLMQQAAAFVFPSNYEGFGIPILEALACGTKVACSNIPALREVGGEACWYFDQRQPTHMADVIYRCLQSNTATTRISALERVQHFSWEQCGQATWQVLLSQVH